MNNRVERNTPGYTPQPDSPSQRVWKLRRRRHYDGFNKFLDLIGFADNIVADLLTQCITFDDFVSKANVCLEYTDSVTTIDKKDFTNFGGCIDNHPTTVRNRRSRRGFVARLRSGILKWGEDYVPVLRDQYAEFRDAFMEEVFA